jgi:hypothetical protein
LHLIPWVKNWSESITKYAPVHFAWEKVNGLESLRPLYESGMPYLYFEDNDGTQWATSEPTIPSQYFRQIVAAATGQTENYDWKHYSGEQNILKTIAALCENCTASR